MEFSVENIQNMNLATLDASIKKLKELSTKQKKADNESTSKRALYIAKKLEIAKTKLTNAIAALKSAKISYTIGGVPTEGNALQFLGVANESLITLAWIGDQESKLESKGIKLDGSMRGINLDTSDFDVGDEKTTRRSIFDIGKDVVSDVGGKDGKNGKRASAIAYSLLGLGLADIASKGITSALGMESLGIFNVLKLAATDFLPNTLWPLITDAATKVWGFSPLGVITIGAFLAIKLIPIIKKKIQDFQKKHPSKNIDKELEALFEESNSKDPLALETVEASTPIPGSTEETKVREAKTARDEAKTKFEAAKAVYDTFASSAEPTYITDVRTFDATTLSAEVNTKLGNVLGDLTNTTELDAIITELNTVAATDPTHATATALKGLLETLKNSPKNLEEARVAAEKALAEYQEAMNKARALGLDVEELERI